MIKSGRFLYRIHDFKTVDELIFSKKSKLCDILSQARQCGHKDGHLITPRHLI